MRKWNWQAIQANMEKKGEIKNETDMHYGQQCGKHQTRKFLKFSSIISMEVGFQK